MKLSGFNLRDLEKSNTDDILKLDQDMEIREKKQRKKSKKYNFDNILPLVKEGNMFTDDGFRGNLTNLY